MICKLSFDLVQEGSVFLILPSRRPEKICWWFPSRNAHHHHRWNRIIWCSSSCQINQTIAVENGRDMAKFTGLGQQSTYWVRQEKSLLLYLAVLVNKRIFGLLSACFTIAQCFTRSKPDSVSYMKVRCWSLIFQLVICFQRYFIICVIKNESLNFRLPSTYVIYTIFFYASWEKQTWNLISRSIVKIIFKSAASWHVNWRTQMMSLCYNNDNVLE